MAETKELKAKKTLRRETRPRDHHIGSMKRIASMSEMEYLKMKSISQEDPDIEDRYLRDHPQHLVQPKKRIGLPKRKKTFVVPRLPWKE